MAAYAAIFDGHQVHIAHRLATECECIGSGKHIALRAMMRTEAVGDALDYGGISVAS